MIALFGASVTGGTNPTLAVNQTSVDYDTAGDYDIILNATNDEGEADTKTVKLTVNAAKVAVNAAKSRKRKVTDK